MANSSKYNERKKYFFLYKTTNLINGKYYIGIHCTNNIKDNYIGSGTVLRRSVRKYGKHNFKCEILEYLSSYSDLKEREKQIVNKDLLGDTLCMNLKVGGHGGFTKEESTKGAIKSNTLRRGMKKGPLPEEVKKKLSDNNHNKDGHIWRGRKHTEASKQKMRKSKNAGSNNPQFGKSHSEETKLKISETLKRTKAIQFHICIS
jgi:group I intron endonuclease